MQITFPNSNIAVNSYKSSMTRHLKLATVHLSEALVLRTGLLLMGSN